MIGKYESQEKFEAALRNRLNSLIQLYNKGEEFPFRVRILGFPVTSFNCEDELLNRIKEMCEILHEPYPDIIKKVGNTTIEMRML